jgi:hypothetical protein
MWKSTTQSDPCAVDPKTMRRKPVLGVLNQFHDVFFRKIILKYFQKLYHT